MNDDTLTEFEITQTLREIVKQTESIGIGITVMTELSKESHLRADKETLLMAVEGVLEHAGRQ